MASSSNQANSSCLPSSSSSSSSTPCWNHDVFLSFRGIDSRKTFTGHLNTALRQAGIRTFLDDAELTKGDQISSQLLTAIEQSRISIVVLSENYASSRWCLDELVKILECKKKRGQIVHPVFYHVDPSHVRHQIGSFANAFAKNRNLEKAESWRAALTEVANFSGWDLQNVANGHEPMLIQMIVEEVTRLVNNHAPLHTTIHPVGMDSRIADLKSLLSSSSDSVCVIGIYGMGGVGKTTLAKAFYNSIFRQFECRYFLENVREALKQPGGLVHLQEKLLSTILLIKNLKVDSVARGTSMMKERLRSKRVLLVLDDIDNSSLNSLVGERDWFGSGSVIIITARDEHLLNWIQVDTKYYAKELNFKESSELFSWHAFKEHFPREDYVGLSNKIITHCGGLPLALEVIGSSLYGRTSKEWEDVFEKLRQFPDHQIQNTLRISFDGLDATEKDIFLDVAFFFTGMDQDLAATVLSACDLFPTIGFTTLREKCLLKLNDGLISMHDLLRDMARQIVHEEFPGKPGKRSRLCFPKDALYVLKKCKGTDRIRGIILDQNGTEEIHLSTQTFEMMDKLIFLKINRRNVYITGSFDHIFEELRWLQWHYFPFKCFPSSFQSENLTVLDLKHSKLNILWEGTLSLENLKILDLHFSRCLMRTPNLRGLPALERLILSDCSSLVEVDSSIGSLSRLVELNLKRCMSLTSLPISICNLRSLQDLSLRDCIKLEGLPEQLGNMKCLKKLDVGRSSYGRKYTCSRVKMLNVLASFYGTCSLEILCLNGCMLAEEDIPNDIGNLTSLQKLLLSRNDFRSLPSSLGQLYNLVDLHLAECENLQSLPELPPNLKILFAAYCRSLEQLPNLKHLRSLQFLSLHHCIRLVGIQGLSMDSYEYFPIIGLRGCDNLVINTCIQSLIKRYSELRPKFEFSLPRMEIPDWFNHQKTTKCSSISFHMPLHLNDFLGFTIFLVFPKHDKLCRDLQIVVVVNNSTLQDGHYLEFSFLKYNDPDLCEEHSRVKYISTQVPIQGGDEIEIFLTDYSKSKHHVELERIGVHLEYESSPHMMEIGRINTKSKRIVRFINQIT